MATAERVGASKTIDGEKEDSMNQDQVAELLYQALETELGGVNLYETAVQCAVNEDLKKEWREYLEQTTNHVEKMRDVLESLGLDPETETPGRRIVRHLGESLVTAMEMARKNGEPQAAELVAAECIALAETKDHLNWELMGEISKNGSGRNGMSVMKEAHKEIEAEEDEHLYHTLGWTRELWMKSLGVRAVIPPPEEKQDVKTMAEAARAKENRLGKKSGSRSSRSTSSKTRASGNGRKKSSRRARSS
jgi:rubrerythrin